MPTKGIAVEAWGNRCMQPEQARQAEDMHKVLVGNISQKLCNCRICRNPQREGRMRTSWRNSRMGQRYIIKRKEVRRNCNFVWISTRQKQSSRWTGCLLVCEKPRSRNNGCRYGIRRRGGGTRTTNPWAECGLFPDRVTPLRVCTQTMWPRWYTSDGAAAVYI